MPKAWFVALASLSKSATPRRVKQNATADHVVVPPARNGPEMTRLIVGPFNRVEGDLEVHAGRADGASLGRGPDRPMYRGFEQILRASDPLDALVIVPRICGICSVSQSVAAPRPRWPTLAGVHRRPTAAGAQPDAGHREPGRPPDALLPVLHARLHAPGVRRRGPGGEALRALPRRPASRRAPPSRRASAGGADGHAGRALAAHAQPAARRQRRAIEPPSGCACWPVREFRAFLERQLFGAPLDAVLALRSEDALLAWPRPAPLAATCAVPADRRRHRPGHAGPRAGPRA
jgi:hypothetical protein